MSKSKDEDEELRTAINLSYKLEVEMSRAEEDLKAFYRLLDVVKGERLTELWILMKDINFSLNNLIKTARVKKEDE